MKPVAAFLIALSIFSCSADKTCRYETEFNRVADSLRNAMKYDRRFSDEELTKDFAGLSCSEFQRKQQMDDHALNSAINSMRTSVSIIDAFRSIEENTRISVEHSPGDSLSAEKPKRDSLPKPRETGERELLSAEPN